MNGTSSLFVISLSNQVSVKSYSTRIGQRHLLVSRFARNTICRQIERNAVFIGNFNDDYGDRTTTHTEVSHLLREVPISKSTVSNMASQFRENVHIRKTNNHRQSALNKEVKLNVLLSAQENPCFPLEKIARELKISQSSMERSLTAHKFHPYKLTILQELTEDDPDCRLQFREQIMEIF